MRKFIFIALLAVSSIAVAGDFYKAGVDYDVITPAQPTDDSSKVEVAEVFWYGCGHCFSFEPFLEPWAKNLAEDVNYKRIPAVFSPQWEVHARAYYTADVLDVSEKTHTALFNAIHNKKQALNTPARLAGFYEAYGIDKELFLNTYKSFVVNTKVSRAKAVVPKFGIQGVPAMVVDGKYLITGPKAKSFENMLKIADFLIAKEREEKNLEAK